MNSEFFSILASTVQGATPLYFAALGGLFAERSGTVDIALEGKMMSAAFSGAAITALTGSLLLGVVAAVSVSVVLSLLQGFAAITCRGDQVISGVAINFMASGLTTTVGLALFQQGGQTPTLEPAQRFLPLALPWADWLASLPIIGGFFGIFLGSQSLFFYLIPVFLIAVSVIVWRTDFGLGLRAAGENPQAADASGRSVVATRYLALVLTGICCAASGLSISMSQMSSFVPEMTAGQGYLALTALIFGRWRPVPVLAVCLLFGFLSTLEGRLQGNALPLFGEIPVQIIQALPFILTLVLLASMRTSGAAPSAIGKPFVRHG
ncbi:ABC transporter permease [Rhizobium leguminosarum bv. viciae]|uniref:ABC transporter permease n=1 Tax=Rhizobium leguminosarum TaxID=384 RepID=UPI0014415EDA|nr:ABC transporter permease [Rhizobium leguminosarum]NKJ94711.1 ABC transporter permease [Rhizobium leguminosarum bv. viciae]NKK87475.1 ABC transporter permease [Rhizobium leguminosarum bv. viciae]